FITSVTVFALLVGIIYLLRATPLYTSTTQVLLEQTQKAPGLDTMATDGRDSFSYLDNQLAILRSDPLLRRVAIKELAPVQTRDSQVAAENDQSSAAAEKAIVAEINRLRERLAVSRSGFAQALNIAITWDDPERAAQLANAVADAYVIDQLDARLELAKR